LLANVLLDEVDKELERRGHAFCRYADDCNVYVRSRRAGEDVMETLRRLYARLRLRVNEAKSAVARPWNRKFLGYSFWVGQGRQVKPRVAARALEAMKERVRELTVRNGGRSREVATGTCGSIYGDGERTSTSRKHPGSSATSMAGYATGCEPSNSNTGSMGERSSGSCEPGAFRNDWPRRPLPALAAGGGRLARQPSTSPCPTPTSTALDYPGLRRNLNLPNRRMRTRMSGGVGGE